MPPSEKPKEKDGVKWDEWTIAEHDKERGTRQKIDEPKTPFVTEGEIVLNVLLESSMSRFTIY